MQHGVLISGASTGIGRTCALELAARGIRVFAGVRRPEDGEALRAAGGDAVVPVRLDVTDGASIASAVAAVAAANGRPALSGLVNNAGVVVAGPLEFLPLDAVRMGFETNVLGLLALTQAALPLLRAGRGRVVNVSSISGRFASPLLGPYAASKFAVEALSDALRRELQTWDLPVVLVEPGAVATPIWEKSAAAARNLLDTLPAEADRHYGEDLAWAERRALRAARRGISSQAVAAVVHRALVTHRPRTRYLVGRDAQIGALLAQWLPDRVMDRLMRRPRRWTPPRD